MSSDYRVVGTVELFPQEGGWHYVRVPIKTSKPLEILAERGLIAITATIGESTWPTSLLPMGDKTHFVAVPKKVREKENIDLGDKIEIKFTVRER